MAQYKGYVVLDGVEGIQEVDINTKGDDHIIISRSWMRDLMSVNNIKEFIAHGKEPNKSRAIGLFAGSHNARGGWEDFISFHENVDKAIEEYNIAYDVDPKAFVWAETVDLTSGTVLWKVMRRKDDA